MLIPLLEESYFLLSCQDILTGRLYLGPLKTSFLNFSSDIIPRSPVTLYY